MKLADLIHAWRFYNKMSVRATAAGIGIPESVLRRFEAGEMVSAPTLLAIMRWAIFGD
jgi:hypothetical protein